MIDRFNRMIRWVLQRMPDVTFTSIQIGNEIDKYLGPDAAYVEFVYKAGLHIRTVRPDVKVGYTPTWQGLARPRPARCSCGSNVR